MVTSPNDVFVFDLDDTLYSERSFVWSGIAFICETVKPFFAHSVDLPQPKEVINQINWIEYLLLYPQISENISKQDLLQLYHNHIPNISLYPDAAFFLNQLKVAGRPMALVSDGRSLTQRNKISVLGLATTFEKVVISEEIGSEKPALRNFEMIANHFPGAAFCFFGDNPRKDFFGPKQLGWKTVGLRDRGANIHSQTLDVPPAYEPDYWINTFDAYK